MQHSPSSAANPQVLRVNRNLVLGERFREDVRGHILSGAVFDVNSPIRDGLLNEVELYVNMLGAGVVVVVRSEVDGGLIVAVQCGGCGDVAEELGGEPAKPEAFFRSVCCGNILSFGGG